ncbi:MAG: GH3 auxin-responsive promoter family protein [Candidatus Omnitrophica bacterium]|nr:GH3 auxin-responsive promoter family protein [Candidatus Omnitrophota bacterium]MCB9719430.1 GH3 auxin-responsive promoter family protein [Candidatus Omnitrophota bacterium]
MNSPKHLLNEVCFAATLGAHRHFRDNLNRIRDTQWRILKDLLAANRSSEFGRRFGFDRIHNVDAYRSAVPVMTYEEYRPWIERIAAGEHGVLTREKVRLLQPTGGSSGGSKLIPYTPALQREFRAGILPWWHDLYRQFPDLRRTRAYWSITPAGHTPQATGPVPIGFDQDAEYFGWRGALLGGTFAVPAAVSGLRHLENYKYLTAYYLLKCADLGLISVWNPTFLTLLLRDIEQYYDQIVEDLTNGEISLPAGEDISRLRRHMRPDPERAAELKSVRTTDGRQGFNAVWKKLKVISCWTDAAAADYARPLRKAFPRAKIQGKGLLATEAVVTIPWSAARGNVPAYTGHFLEFLEESTQQSCLTHELRAGETYRVVVSTGGGLYRYDIGDRVQVTGLASGVPLLAFLGRDNVVDLVGEKLEESHVHKVISDILARMNIDTRFVMLAPERIDGGGYYVLYIETQEPELDSLLRQARVMIDTALKDNMQYAHARNIGQLQPLKVFHIRATGDRSYYQRCLQEGQRMGDIKPAILDRRTGWEDFFRGRMLENESAGVVEPGQVAKGGKG